LGLIQFGIIPWVVKLAAYFELFFVNSLGLPFNSGTVFYFIVLIGGIIWGLWYTRKKGKVILNTIVLCVTFIIIGYSTFLTLVIRSNANTPLNENAPKDAISLLSFLLREQYGDWPIGYGQYYNAPLDSQEPYKDGTPVYTKDEKAGKYIITDARKNTIPNYDSRFCTIFPRMYSSQSEHITGYKNWGNVKGTPIEVTNNEGKTETLYKPTFGENLRFFFSYQLGHMYLRYFMWNFVGRQNDIQGNGGSTEGNWLSGIKFIDEMRLGPQDNLPDFMSRNKGMNKFYFLPLILGLLGLIYHYTKDKNNFFVVLLFFFMTGIAINIYLNPVPYQPRERDYAYAGSFYVFAIWLGLGVIGIYDKIGDKIPGVIRSIVITLVCLLCVPVVMAKGGWNDHDRSHRYTSTDFAKDYLMSCEKDAILFTNGDNDTFPLWNVQEVEGFRTDVKVVNLSLLNTDWYIDQMKRKTYDGDPVPFSLTNEKYRQGTRDYIYFIEDDKLKDQYQDVKDMIDFVSSDDPRTKYQTSRGLIEYFPSRKFSLKVDSTLCLKNGTVSGNLASQMVSALQWDVKGYGVMKNSLMVLDLLAHFNWKRPVYFAITTGNDSYIGLDSYMQLEGLAYRLVPIKTISHDGQTGRINTDKMYDNLMYKFKWGNMDNPKVYLDETNMRMTMNFRNNFARLANELINEGKISKAIKCLDRCLEVMPEKSVPYNYFILPVAEAYYRAGAIDKANNLVNRLSEIYDRELNYYFAFNKSMAKDIDNDKQRDLSVMQRLIELSKGYKQDVLAKNIEGKFKSFYNRYMLEGGGQQQRQQGQPEQQQD
ncbi:MAG: hypothetical protein Q8880_10045, partial [Bacteroidota bacterium]|nr:hypothetical protein [Bacteroidota bacterium]